MQVVMIAVRMEGGCPRVSLSLRRRSADPLAQTLDDLLSSAHRVGVSVLHCLFVIVLLTAAVRCIRAFSNRTFDDLLSCCNLSCRSAEPLNPWRDLGQARLKDTLLCFDRGGLGGAVRWTSHSLGLCPAVRQISASRSSRWPSQQHNQMQTRHSNKDLSSNPFAQVRRPAAMRRTWRCRMSAVDAVRRTPAAWTCAPSSATCPRCSLFPLTCSILTSICSVMHKLRPASQLPAHVQPAPAGPAFGILSRATCPRCSLNVVIPFSMLQKFRANNVQSAAAGPCLSPGAGR